MKRILLTTAALGLLALKVPAAAADLAFKAPPHLGAIRYHGARSIQCGPNLK
ncbi:MAG: hypothetical protein JO283_16380 [Bradyrhizobium sp.]|nr:hypothetical protein [Bradyrhizobium sp.]